MLSRRLLPLDGRAELMGEKPSLSEHCSSVVAASAEEDPVMRFVAADWSVLSTRRWERGD